MLLKILKYWMKKKVNQQQQHLLLPFVVRRATNHNPVGIHFQNAQAAARFNIATRTANERIGEQEDTNKNASDQVIEKEEKKGGSSGQKQIKINTRCKTLHHSVWSNFVFEK